MNKVSMTVAALTVAAGIVLAAASTRPSVVGEWRCQGTGRVIDLNLRADHRYVTKCSAEPSVRERLTFGSDQLNTGTYSVNEGRLELRDDNAATRLLPFEMSGRDRLTVDGFSCSRQ